MAFLESGEILSVLSVAVSAIVSFLAARFYSGRWVEMSRRLREHSVKLTDGVLKPWRSKADEYCKIDATYSSDAGKIVGIEPQDPNNLEFYDAARSHLEMKYPKS